MGVEPRVLAGMGATLVAAVIIRTALPFLAWIIGTLGVLTHEMGHATVGWLLGRPSLPAFDLSGGGGVTMIGERHDLLLAGYGAAIAAFLWTRRANPLALGVIGGLAVALGLLACSDFWSETAVSAAGHAGELAIAGIFLFRALTGVAVAHAAERWLYALVGWMVLLQTAWLAWSIVHDIDLRDIYLQGKRGIDNDLITVGEDLDISLDAVCGWTLALCVATPLGAWALWRWRAGIGRAARRVLAANP